MIKWLWIAAFLIIGSVAVSRLKLQPPEATGSTEVTRADAPSAYYKAPDAESRMRLAKEEALYSAVKIVKFSWSADYGIMKASFTFENTSDFDVKDLVVECSHSAASGTQIDSNTLTIYQAIPARSKKSVNDFNMGFIHSQAAKSGCAVKSAIPTVYRPVASTKAK